MLTQSEVIDAISALDTTPDTILAACRKVADTKFNPTIGYEAQPTSADDVSRLATEIFKTFSTRAPSHTISLACLKLGATIAAHGMPLADLEEALEKIIGLIETIFAEILIHRLVHEKRSKA